MEYPITNSLGEVTVDAEIQALNSDLEALDRQNHRDVLQVYFDLFENDPQAFSKENTKAYNFAPLSSIMAE